MANEDACDGVDTKLAQNVESDRCPDLPHFHCFNPENLPHCPESSRRYIVTVLRHQPRTLRLPAMKQRRLTHVHHLPFRGVRCWPLNLLLPKKRWPTIIVDFWHRHTEKSAAGSLLVQSYCPIGLKIWL